MARQMWVLELESPATGRSERRRHGSMAESHAKITAADRLLEVMRHVRIVDLTVPIASDLPCQTPESYPFFLNVLNDYSLPRGRYLAHFISTGDHVGTHVDSPNHFVPATRTSLPSDFLASVQAAELPDNPRATVAELPIGQLMGPALVIDVRYRCEGVPPGEHTVFEHSPVITVDDVELWEHQHGPIQPGDVVIFWTGWTDRYYRRFPEGYSFDRSHPGLDARAVHYLADRGVRTLGIDTHGPGRLDDDVSPHWAMGIRDIASVVRLCNLGLLPARGAYFQFLPIKIEEVSGGLGRAIAFV
jgi:kynurenine formamidase